MLVKVLLFILLPVLAWSDPYVPNLYETTALLRIFPTRIASEVLRNTKIGDYPQVGDRSAIYQGHIIYVSKDHEKEFKDNLFLIHEATHYYQDTYMLRTDFMGAYAPASRYVVRLEDLTVRMNVEQEAEVVRQVAMWYLSLKMNLPVQTFVSVPIERDGYPTVPDAQRFIAYVKAMGLLPKVTNGNAR